MGIKLGELFLTEMKYDTYKDALDFFYSVELRDAEKPLHDMNIQFADDVSDDDAYQYLAFELFNVYTSMDQLVSSEKYDIKAFTANYVVNMLLNYLACDLISADQDACDSYFESPEVRDEIKSQFDYESYCSGNTCHKRINLQIVTPRRGQIDLMDLCPASKIKTMSEFMKFFMMVLRYNYTYSRNLITVRLIKYKPFDEEKAKLAAVQSINSSLSELETCVTNVKSVMEAASEILGETDMQQYYDKYKCICGKEGE